MRGRLLKVVGVGFFVLLLSVAAQWSMSAGSTARPIVVAVREHAAEPVDLLVAGDAATVTAEGRWRQVVVNPQLFQAHDLLQSGTRLRFTPFADCTWDVVVQRVVQATPEHVIATAQQVGHPNVYLDIDVLPQRVVLRLVPPQGGWEYVVAADQGNVHIATERRQLVAARHTPAAAVPPSPLMAQPAPTPMVPVAVVPDRVVAGTKPSRIAVDATGTQRFHGAKIFGNGHPVAIDQIPESRFRRQMLALAAPERERALAAMQKQCIPEADFASLQVDATGHLLYACRQLPAPAAAVPSSAPPIVQATVPVTASPLLRHTRSGSANVLYLDFHGPTISGTYWNLSKGVSTYVCKPWSNDADLTTFSDAELTIIDTLWQRMADDFSPFDIDVTTEYPAVWTSTTGHVVFTPTIDVNGVALPHDQYGGIAYVGVFGASNYSYGAGYSFSPAWVSAYSGYGASYMAEAAAHEFGHNLGLSHDGLAAPVTEYYGGHEAFSGTGIWWNTIMGGGSFNEISQWSQGEYYQANNPEDDLAIIAAKLGYRPADRGASSTVATPVTVMSASDFTADGVIERTGGEDWFSFVGAAGTFTIVASPYQSTNGWGYGGDADLRIELYDSSLRLIDANDASFDVDALFQDAIGSETYYIRVTVPDATVGDPLAVSPVGYTRYGILGQYTLSGHIALTPASVVAVSGNGVAIGNGDHVPDSGDGTDFGTVAAGQQHTQTFIMENTGGQAVYISGVGALEAPAGMQASTQFSVSAAPIFPMTLGAGAQVSFDITFSPDSDGPVTALILVQNGSEDFSFYVSGLAVVPPPTITSVAPALGVSSGNSLVTVSGTNLANGVVTFDGVAAATQIGSTDSALIVRTPAHAAGTVDVQVQTNSGTTTLAGGFTYGDAPAIWTLSPQAGSISGQTPVSLTGSGFTGATVTLAGVVVAATVHNDSTLDFVTGAHASGTVDLVVTNPFGSATRAGAFTYVDPPNISALAPASGSDAGGTLVTITGQRFGGAAVTFDGVLGVVTSLSATQLVVRTPAHAPGTVAMVVTTNFGQATADFTYLPLPTVAHVAPTVGPLVGGTLVTVDGTHLSGALVTFGGVAAITDMPGGGILPTAETQLQVFTPSHIAGWVDMAISNSSGTTVTVGAFEYRAAPVLSTVTPRWFVPTVGGTVTLTGSHLAEAQVRLNGVLHVLASNSATTITIALPPLPAGLYDVEITTPGGAVTLAGAVRYADPPTLVGVTPAFGPVAGGTQVVLDGSHLSGAVVTMGGSPATVLVDGEDQLTVSAPAHAAGPVSVSVTTGVGESALSNAFTYLGAPTVSVMNPVSGPAGGGTNFTISGTNLLGASVLMGGVPAVLTGGTNTQVTGVTPAHAAGTVAVQVVAGGGTVNTITGFHFVAFPAITSITPDHSPLAGGVTMTITGTGLAAAVVTVDGAVVTKTLNTDTQIVVVSPAHAAGMVVLQLTNAGGSLTASIDYHDDVPVPTPNSGGGGGGGGCGAGGGLALLLSGVMFLRWRRRAG